MKFFSDIIKIPARTTVLLISLYQHSFSPDHGWFKDRYPYGYCRHYPSCSEYAKQAIIKFGLIRGGVMATARIIKCNPWVKPSVDLVPKT